MKTFCVITAIVLASIWVARFVAFCLFTVNTFRTDRSGVIFRRWNTKERKAIKGKTLSWNVFWNGCFKFMKSKPEKFLYLITGAPIWGFLLYMVIESIIIVGKKICNWL